MEAMELKQSLLSTINNVDERDTDLLEKLTFAVKNILRQNNGTHGKDEITPFVNSMKTGTKLPANLDIKALRNEHFEQKYI